MGSTAEPLCDVCNAAMEATAGYLVPNQAVVASEAYWVSAFESGRGLTELFGIADKKQLTSAFSQRLQLRSQDGTPWRICEDCTDLIIADWVVARDHALHGTRPDSERVDAAEFVLPAARAWERVYGWWPKKVVKRARPDDECDLCRKPIWATEQVSFLKADLVADWRRDGVLDADPVRPARVPRTNPDVTGWLACPPCQARMYARLYRFMRPE